MFFLLSIVPPQITPCHVLKLLLTNHLSAISTLHLLSSNHCLLTTAGASLQSCDKLAISVGLLFSYHFARLRLGCKRHLRRRQTARVSSPALRASRLVLIQGK